MKTTEEILEDARSYMGLTRIDEMGLAIGAKHTGLTIKKNNYSIWIGETKNSGHGYRIKVSCEANKGFSQLRRNISISFSSSDNNFIVRGSKESIDSNLGNIDRTPYLSSIGKFIYQNKDYLMALIDLMNSGEQPDAETILDSIVTISEVNNITGFSVQYEYDIKR